MSYLTYIASDRPLEESPLLWPLSIGSEDIYTKKKYVAEVDPGLTDLSQVVSYIRSQVSIGNELEIWRIWQGVEYAPVIRSQNIPAAQLTIEDLKALTAKDVLNTTATQYDLPVQYRIIISQD